MPKKMSIDAQAILHRLRNNSTTWDGMIAETKAAIQRLQESLEFFQERKRNGAPFPVNTENAPSTQN